MDTYKNNSYNICCFDPLQYRCDQNHYSRVDYPTQECIPLSPEDIIHGCVHYANWIDNYYGSESGVLCQACDSKYYLSNNSCINIQKKVEHCKLYIYEDYYKDYFCHECEFGYHIKNYSCYKIPSKIENCHLYEDFYNNEFACLKTEKDEIKKEENSVNDIFYNYLYLLLLYLLL